MALFTPPIGRLAFPGLCHEERDPAPSSNSGGPNCKKRGRPARAKKSGRPEKTGLEDGAGLKSGLYILSSELSGHRRKYQYRLTQIVLAYTISAPK